MSGLRGGKKVIHLCLPRYLLEAEEADRRIAAGQVQHQCEHGRWLWPEQDCSHHVMLDARG